MHNAFAGRRRAPDAAICGSPCSCGRSTRHPAPAGRGAPARGGRGQRTPGRRRPAHCAAEPAATPRPLPPPPGHRPDYPRRPPQVVAGDAWVHRQRRHLAGRAQRRRERPRGPARRRTAQRHPVDGHRTVRGRSDPGGAEHPGQRVTAAPRPLGAASPPGGEAGGTTHAGPAHEEREGRAAGPGTWKCATGTTRHQAPALGVAAGAALPHVLDTRQARRLQHIPPALFKGQSRYAVWHGIVGGKFGRRLLQKRGKSESLHVKPDRSGPPCRTPLPKKNRGCAVRGGCRHAPVIDMSPGASPCAGGGGPLQPIADAIAAHKMPVLPFIAASSLVVPRFTDGSHLRNGLHWLYFVPAGLALFPPVL